MFNKIFLYLKNFDWVLLASAVLLICFGLAELYSIALGQDSFDLLNFKKQIVFVIFGLILLFCLAFFDYFNFRSFNNYFYLLGLILLVGVLFFGSSIRGTRGWFNFFGLSLQPVEFVKIILVVFLARYFSSVAIKYNPFRHIFISGLGTLFFVLLILKQPDFGSALILFLVWLSMVVIVGFNKKYILFIIFMFALSFSLAWAFVFKDYQKERVMTFINPSARSLDGGYNVSQAIIAVGSGGLTGRGLGFGSQSQLKFLPEAQNDFIFAVIAEELGFFGVGLVFFLFAVIFFRLLKGAHNASNDFAVYTLLGFLTLIFIEMFINIGMNIGLMPVVGISLPFISSGGSSIVATLMMIGVAESVIIRSKIKY